MRNVRAPIGFPADYKRDYYGGALMLLIGVGATVRGMDYEVGSLTAMGSGFFPVTLGIILTFLGILIAGTAKRPVRRPTAHEGALHDERSGPEWRGWICILGSVAAFVILGRWGGLLPATFAITFISALGDRDNSWRAAVLLGAGVSLVSVVVFWWALQLQFPLFTWG